MSIRENVNRILNELPPDVELVAAAKTRTPDEIREAVEAGIRVIGENYVQEAARAVEALGKIAQIHCIGRLQKNKVKKAVALFDMIETVDSLELAAEIDRHCAPLGMVMPVLIEINSAREPQKSGVFPEQAEALIRSFSGLKCVRVEGLMTMGPFLARPEDIRPYFRETRACFDRLRSLDIDHAGLRFLSMGMSDSYNVAIEEGANLVRIGTKIFGQRLSATR